MKVANNLGAELDYLRDNLLEAVKQEKTGLLKEGLDTYFELIRAFVEEMKVWGSPYQDKRRATEEVGSFEGGWSEVEWIRRDLFEVIDASLSTNNINILSEVLYFPVKLASLAFSELDFYIYYQFIRAIPYAYSASQRVHDKEVERFIVDRTWRYPVELSNFVMAPEIERSPGVEELETRGQFALSLYPIFGNLLKRAYDHGRPLEAKAFSEGLHSLFEFYRRENIQRGSLEIEDLQPKQESANLVVTKAHQRLVESMELRKALVPYGLHAWILHEFDVGEISDSAVQEWVTKVPTIQDWRRNWEVFLDARDHEIVREFGWDWWEFSKRAESRGVMVGYGGFEGHLELFWVIESLRLLGRMTPEERSSATIPPSEDVLYLAGGTDSSLFRLVSAVESAASKWTPIVGHQGIESIPVLKVKLEEAAKLQRSLDVRAVVDSPLSPERIQDVKQSVLAKWKDTAIVRTIVQANGRYEFLETAPAGIGYFGFNMLDRKDVYVAESRVSNFGWGEEYGRGLGEGENNFVIKEILSALPQFRQEMVTMETAGDHLDLAISDLVRRGYTPIVLALDSWWVSRWFTQSSLYKGPEDGAPSWLLGFFDDRPIVTLHHTGVSADSMVLLVDLKRVGVWKQYKPKKVFETEELISTELSFYVSPFDPESAQKLVKEQPDFRRDQEGTLRPEEEVIAEILQRVHLRIVEQFEFKLDDQQAGYQLPMAPH